MVIERIRFCDPSSLAAVRYKIIEIHEIIREIRKEQVEKEWFKDRITIKGLPKLFSRLLAVVVDWLWPDIGLPWLTIFLLVCVVVLSLTAADIAFFSSSLPHEIWTTM